MFGMLGHILKNLTSTPATRNYPFDVREPFENARGHLVCDIDKCIFCTLCEKVCPADSIRVDRANKKWDFNPYTCIICGVCVEACRKEALYLEPVHRKAAYEKEMVSLTPDEGVQEEKSDADNTAG